jgi:hypothetical protein
MKALITIAMVVMFGMSAAAWANCVRDGRPYKTGERVGPFTCMADGQWRR